MDRVLFNVRRAGVRYAAHAAKVLRRWHFTHSRVDVFVIHARAAAYHGVVYQSDIRAQLGVARRTMSVMMRRMERRGFIERRRAEDDRRKIVVTVTELGQRTFSQVRAVLGEGLFTPIVNANLMFHDFATAVPKKRAHFLGYLAIVRSQFGDFSSSPYPP